MTIDTVARSALNYAPYRIGKSRLLFRGPKRNMSGDYVAFLGGTETYGKFLAHPYPDLVEQRLGMPCVNLGWINAGLDVYLKDAAVMEIADRARLRVVQITGAHNLSNRYYTVHPRRNDRFLQASSMLRTLYRDVDFTAFHFTRHMLQTLEALSPDRFALVREELEKAWIARMRGLIDQLRGPTILLWFAEHSADQDSTDASAEEPLFVNRSMIDGVCDEGVRCVEVKVSAQALQRRLEGMVLGPSDMAAAREMLGSAAHDEAAQALIGPMRGLLAQ